MYTVIKGICTGKSYSISMQLTKLQPAAVIYDLVRIKKSSLQLIENSKIENETNFYQYHKTNDLYTEIHIWLLRVNSLRIRLQVVIFPRKIFSKGKYSIQ